MELRKSRQGFLYDTRRFQDNLSRVLPTFYPDDKRRLVYVEIPDAVQASQSEMARTLSLFFVNMCLL